MAKAPVKPEAAAQRPLILVVDDSEDIRNFFRVMLKPRYDTRLAGDGAAALLVGNSGGRPVENRICLVGVVARRLVQHVEQGAVVVVDVMGNVSRPVGGRPGGSAHRIFSCEWVSPDMTGHGKRPIVFAETGHYFLDIILFSFNIMIVQNAAGKVVAPSRRRSFGPCPAYSRARKRCRSMPRRFSL